MFLIFLARSPNRSVPMVSCKLNSDGEQVMIRVVFELPPMESWSILVSTEFL